MRDGEVGGGEGSWLLERSMWPSVGALVLVMVVFELSGLDLWIQDHFYDFGRHEWVVNAKSFWPRWICYMGPKVGLWVFGVYAGLQCVMPQAMRQKLWGGCLERRKWVVVWVTMVVAPLTVAGMKAVTNVHTPSQIVRYDGEVEYVKVTETFAEGKKPEKRGRGFPAGHASGGFALWSLYGLVRGRREQWWVLVGVMGLGWLMGGYQMLKGAHYMSHTVVSMIWCWLVFIWVRRLVGLREEIGVVKNGR